MSLQVCLKECVFTGVGAAALADVLIINNHIDSIDIRACQGTAIQSPTLHDYTKYYGYNSGVLPTGCSKVTVGPSALGRHI